MQRVSGATRALNVLTAARSQSTSFADAEYHTPRFTMRAPRAQANRCFGTPCRHTDAYLARLACADETDWPAASNGVQALSAGRAESGLWCDVGTEVDPAGNPPFAQAPRDHALQHLGYAVLSHTAQSDGIGYGLGTDGAKVIRLTILPAGDTRIWS